MLGEITHLQAIVDDLTVLTEDPHKLPPASEQVISNIHTKEQDFPYAINQSCKHTCLTSSTTCQTVNGLSVGTACVNSLLSLSR